MKLQDVLLKAMAKKISWLEAAEIAGVTDRTIRRIRDRYEEFGYTGLFDQRKGKRSIHRIPMETAEEVLRLYKEVYFDLNMRHFHEKLREEHEIELSYTWVQQALQGAGMPFSDWVRQEYDAEMFAALLLHANRRPPYTRIFPSA